MLRQGLLREDHLKKNYVNEVVGDVKGRSFKRGKIKEPSPNLITA